MPQPLHTADTTSCSPASARRGAGRRGRALLRCAVVAGLALSAVGALSGPASAAPRTVYYLAIGASESLGVEPVAAHPPGRPTDQGYADDLLATERARWPGLSLVQVGCAGQTAVVAVNGGGKCPYPEGSQLGAALAFLRTNPGATVLVTVDLGFNDIRVCLAHRRVDRGCLDSALDAIGRVLPGALAQLRAAGGPAMQIVGLEHNDPFLAEELDGPAGQAFAAASKTAVDQLNQTLAGIYTAAGAAVADVPRAFDLGDQRPVHLTGVGTVPAEVAELCELSWACTNGPFEHNVHPNPDGYQAIAGAVAAAVDQSANAASR